MGEIAILNQKGDELVEWDPADEESTKKANEQFDKLQKEGYEFFEVENAKGKKVKKFKKGLGKVIASPAAKKAKGKKAMGGGPVHARVGA